MKYCFYLCVLAFSLETRRSYHSQTSHSKIDRYTCEHNSEHPVNNTHMQLPRVLRAYQTMQLMECFKAHLISICSGPSGGSFGTVHARKSVIINTVVKHLRCLVGDVHNKNPLWKYTHFLKDHTKAGPPRG